MREKQNLTISLDRGVLRKAKVLAAQRETSVSALVGDLIERLVGDTEAYEAARREALDLLDHGFHLGGRVRAKREDLHERKSLR